MNLPPEFTSRMSALLAEEYTDFLASYDEPPLTGLRTNTLKISPAALARLWSGLAPVSWCDTGFYTPADARPGKSPYYHAGLYYIQEPSAMAPASVIDVRPGMRVLDLCAAPGGKSTQLAAKLAGQGVLVANDISPARARALLKNLELCGVANSVVTTEPPARLSARFAGYFDRILVDAPCSGEGMFRRDPDARRHWSAHKPAVCVALQRETLHHAAAMLAPGGQLVYSTCTFAPEEDERLIADFLSENAHSFTGVPIPHARYGFAPGLYGEPHTARLWPHKQKGEGHFLAYLQKNDDDQPAPDAAGSPAAPAKRGAGRTNNRCDVPPEFAAFCERYLTTPPVGVFSVHGQSLHLLPPGLPDESELNGVRLLRCGLYLGELLTKRFEPSQAFAMTLTPADVRNTVDFQLNDDGLSRYLKGESLALTCADGWNLVTLDGFPIGWGKAVDGRLKNKYPRGWIDN